MRLKTTLQNKPKHSDVVSCVGWITSDDLYSCADDHILLQWNLPTSETNQVTEFMSELFPLDMHWLPKTAMQKMKAGTEVFLLTSADGKFHIVGRNGRIEKSVDAHKGAVLVGKWSHDGASLLTGGEDGLLKIWSRNGMLRSTLAQCGSPLYSAAWSPGSECVLYSTGGNLFIKPLAPNLKAIQWRAHEGIILKVAWNPNTELILSGGEDTRYKVWDRYGRLMYASVLHNHPITSLAWAPDGQIFVVGGFNTIRLCDKAGWCHSLEKPTTGSIFNLAWSNDGTQVAGACGNGQVLIAHVIESHLVWKNYEATVTSRTCITLRNVSNDTKEKLELRDRIIKVSLCHNHMVVVTSTQVYVYSTRNWNTPIIFDLKEGNASLLIQAERHFLLVDGANIYIYTYDGRPVCSPRWKDMRTDVLNIKTVSLSNDTLAVRDKRDEKFVYFFDATTGKPLNDGKPWAHKIEVVEIALDQVGSSYERQLAVVDRNRDLFMLLVQRVGSFKRPIKLGAMIQSLCWNDTANVLCALQDAKFTVWFYPSVVFVDKGLLRLTMTERETSDYSKNASLVSFLDTFITMRRSDGSLITTNISPYPSLLHSYISSSHWEDAVRLARFVNEDVVWSCLAAAATLKKELETAEVAYAAINQADKVQYIQYIKQIPIKEARQAEMSLFGGHVADAEVILLKAGLYFRAIMLNIQTYSWDVALMLAEKYKTHLDTVLAYRKRYLLRFGKEETNKKFLEYEKKVEIDWGKIQEKVLMEYQKEREQA